MEKCDRCGEEGPDRRTLYMACLYKMEEFDVPFKEVETDAGHFYILVVCKNCRADWLQAIEDWFKAKPAQEEGVGSGIFVRVKGAIREVTEEEFQQIEIDAGRIPRNPIRLKKGE